MLTYADVPGNTGRWRASRAAGSVGEAGAGDGEAGAGEMPGANAKSDVACLAVGGSGNNRFFTVDTPPVPASSSAHLGLLGRTCCASALVASVRKTD